MPPGENDDFVTNLHPHSQRIYVINSQRSIVSNVKCFWTRPQPLPFPRLRGEFEKNLRLISF